MISGSKKTMIIVLSVIAAVCAPSACVVVYMYKESLQTYAKVFVVGSTVLIEYAAFK